jgi:EmrB/QacA subfamily drug resistance transporter
MPVSPARFERQAIALPARPESRGGRRGSTPVRAAGRARTPRTANHTSGPSGLSGRALALVLVASFMVVLDFSIVNVALPSIRQALGFGGDSVEWVVTAYAITFGGLLILGGRLADILGRRRMFVVGLATFAGASLAAGLTGDAGLLVAARALQGASAALVAPASLSIITAHYAEGPGRTRALGLYGATASIGFVAGQVLGGVLVQYTTWRSIFLVNVPVGLAAALLARLMLARDHPRAGGFHIDASGALLSTIAVGALVFAISEGAVLGWSHVLVIGSLALAVAAMAGFVLVERVHPHPLVDLSLLRRPGLRTAGILSLLLGLWTAGELVVLSVYLQQSLHDSPLVAGLVIAPQGAVGFVTGLFGVRLVRRLGMRGLLMLATASTGAGFLILMDLPNSGHYSPLFAAVVLVGFGTVGTVFGTTVLAASGMAASDQGLVGGVVNTTRQVGAAVGVAVLVALADGSHARLGISTVNGDRTAMLAAALIAFTGTLVAWVGTRPRAVVGQDVSAAVTQMEPSSTAGDVPTRLRRSA